MNNREIKFRARDEENERWIYLTLQELSYKSDEGAITVDGKWSDIVHFDDLKNWGISTGLTDKEDQLIYEGDILEDLAGEVYVLDSSILPFDRMTSGVAARVGYRDESGNIKIREYQDTNDDWASWSDEYEVIGNIYEDTHLLDDVE